MSINRAEMQTVWTVAAAVALFVALQWLHEPLDKLVEHIGYVKLYVVLEMVSFGVCFALLALGWLIFVQTLCRLRLLTAAMFALIGSLDLLQGLSMPGMPLYSEQAGAVPPALLGIFSHSIAAIGLLVLFAMRNANVPPRSRFAAMIFVLASLGALGLFALNSGISMSSVTTYRHAWLMIVAVLYASAACVILYRHRRERPQAMLTIVQGLIWLFISVMEHAFGAGASHELFAEGFKLAGYFCLLVGIYYVSIEEPLKRRKEMEAQIKHMAFHDELTGLPNRSMFVERVEAAMNSASRNKRKFALLWLDLDRFKTINDSLGHATGDQLLIVVAKRLSEFPLQQDQLFRIGGDEFTLLLPNTGAQEAEQAAQQLVDLFKKPLRIGSSVFHLSVSVGIVVYPDDGSDVIALQQNADTAMYSAKETRNNWKRYIPEMNVKAKERLLLENELRIALEQNQFRLAYQPLIDLESGQLAGVEALIRWQHPRRGEIPPAEFISLCEENGFIIPLGEWVLKSACSQAKAWQTEGYPPMIIAVNLSILQFRQHDLAERIEQILTETGLEARYLELEITESIMADVKYAARTLKRLKAIGVRISIDDFGTGYSSLNYLKRFPIDKLKIDRSFICDVLTDRSDAAIVSGISAMARNLNLKVTAEGVENEAQVAFLKEQRCQEAQGFYFSKPVMPEKLIQMFKSNAV